jgi:cyanophycin synthetase
VIATPGDRRVEDMRELGRTAARYFDEIIVREDKNLRGRAPGETAEIVLEGVNEAIAKGGIRAGSAWIVLDEMDATRAALDRSRPGDLVLLCADYATEVYKELERRRGVASPQALPAAEAGMVEAAGGDPDLLGIHVTPG